MQEPEVMQSDLRLKKCNRPINALTHNLVSRVAPRKESKKSKFCTPTYEPPGKDDSDTEKSNHGYSMSDTAINGIVKYDGGNNSYHGTLVNGVREGHGTEYKTILVDGIPNVYRHYKGHFSMGLKNG